jgi:sugar phosphate isomerase/epimerase
MQLGILTAPSPIRRLRQVADYAAAPGFEALEIACWPASRGREAPLCRDRSPAGRGHDRRARSEIMGMLAAKGLTVSGLGYYPNPLHADAAPPRGGHRPPEEGHHGGGA